MVSCAQTVNIAQVAPNVQIVMIPLSGSQARGKVNVSADAAILENKSEKTL
jgi:hypothetical protein